MKISKRPLASIENLIMERRIVKRKRKNGTRVISSESIDSELSSEDSSSSSSDSSVNKKIKIKRLQK